jgi:hypothetical protein
MKIVGEIRMKKEIKRLLLTLYVLGWFIFFLLMVFSVVTPGINELMGVRLTGLLFYSALIIVFHLIIYVVYLVVKLIIVRV